MHGDSNSSSIVQRTSTARQSTNDKSCKGVIGCHHHHHCFYTLAVLYPACLSLVHYSPSAWDPACHYGPCQFVSLCLADHPSPHWLEKKKESYAHHLSLSLSQTQVSCVSQCFFWRSPGDARLAASCAGLFLILSQKSLPCSVASGHRLKVKSKSSMQCVVDGCTGCMRGGKLPFVMFGSPCSCKSHALVCKLTP